MNKIIITILICCMMSSCIPKQAIEITVSDEPFILTTNEINLTCEPPLKILRNSATIQIMINEEWEAESPWDKIKLKNGALVNLDIALFDTTGKKYIPDIIGSAIGKDGKWINLMFIPPLSKNIEINLIKLKSNVPLTVNKIIWHNFDPK